MSLMILILGGFGMSSIAESDRVGEEIE